MTLVIVERQFEEPVDFEKLLGSEEEAAWCVELYRVRYLRTYLSADRRRMVCLYEAPDAEAVRQVQRQSGTPFERIWPADMVGAPPAGEGETE